MSEILRINRMKTIHTVIGVIIMFGFPFLPPIKPITPLGMQIAGIFLGLIYLWSVVDTIWPSIIGVLALGMTSYSNVAAVLLNAFGNTVSIQLLFIMILFGGIQHSGVTTYISRWFLTRKVINGRPFMFSFVFIYTAFILSSLTNVTPALLLMWAILYEVLNSVGYKKGDKYTSVMVIGTFIGSIAGQSVKPFTGAPLLIVGAFEKVTKSKLDYLPYMLFTIIMSTVIIVIFALVIKFVFKPDVSKIANINVNQFDKDKLPKMNFQQKVLFTTLFGIIAAFLIPSILPKSFYLVKILDKLGPHGIVLGFLTLLLVIRSDGKPIIDYKAISSKYVSWDVWFLVCAAMVISSALTADSTGIKPFLTSALSPLLGGSSMVFIIAIIVFSLIITQFANNGVMGVVLMPVIYPFALQHGLNIAEIATIMIFCLHLAIMTPAASPFACIMFGNTDWVTPNEVRKYSVYFLAIAFIITLVFAMPLVRLLF